MGWNLWVVRDGRTSPKASGLRRIPANMVGFPSFPIYPCVLETADVHRRLPDDANGSLATRRLLVPSVAAVFTRNPKSVSHPVQGIERIRGYDVGDASAESRGQWRRCGLRSPIFPTDEITTEMKTKRNRENRRNFNE